MKFRHEIVRRYEPAAGQAIFLLRVSPRNHDGQHVFSWRIDLDKNCRLGQSEDAFGNLSHHFTLDGPVEEIRVLVEGEVETEDAAGLVRGTLERLPPALFMRQTEPPEGVDTGALAAEIRAAFEPRPLDQLHGLMRRLHENPPAAEGAGPAPPGESRRRLAETFIAIARRLGHPARYVSGYRKLAEGDGGELCAWAEAHASGIGWIGFDPAACLCPTESYVRVAVALDRLGAAPVRSQHNGVAAESGSDTIAIVCKNGIARV